MYSGEPGTIKAWLLAFIPAAQLKTPVQYENVKGTAWGENLARMLPDSQSAIENMASDREQQRYGREYQEMVQRDEAIGKFILLPCLSFMRQQVVVPDGAGDLGRWKMLEGHLNTLSYGLEIVALASEEITEDRNSDDITVRITKGPEYKPNHSHHPVDISRLADLCEIRSSLLVLHAKDLEAAQEQNTGQSLHASFVASMVCHSTLLAAKLIQTS